MCCPWLLAQTKVATIFGNFVPSGVCALPVAAGKTKVATIFDIFPLVGEVGVVGVVGVGVVTLLAFTLEGIVVGF